MLLLHGYPQTHLMWRHHRGALEPSGATVITADLAGYGAWFRPTPAPDSAALEEGARDRPGGDGRARARAFAVAGARPRQAGRLPDGARPSRAGQRGRRAGRRPPVRCGRAPTPRWRSATGTGRSSPSRTVARAAHRRRSRRVLRPPRPRPRPRAAPDRYPPDLMAAYRELLDDPGTVEAICEDYRAGPASTASTTRRTAGSGGIECPLLALWSAGGALAAVLRRRPRRLATVGRRVSGSGDGRQPLPRRGPARADITDGLSAFPGQHTTLGGGTPVTATDRRPNHVHRRAMTNTQPWTTSPATSSAPSSSTSRPRSPAARSSRCSPRSRGASVGMAHASRARRSATSSPGPWR